MADPFSEIAGSRVRIRVPAGGDPHQAVTVTLGPLEEGQGTNTFPAKEWTIIDDVLNVADTATVTIANIDGENSDKFYEGQRVEIDESDSTVADGAWCRVFTGIITSIAMGSDASGGSTILLTMMDNGWFLTSCHAKPLTRTNGITLGELCRRMLDASWRFPSTTVQNGPTIGNALNRRLKQGRQGVMRQFVPPKTILPFIQVEPGQAPFDILRTYCEREGLLINVGAKGELILFRPSYDDDDPFAVEYHPLSSPQSIRNNVKGRPQVTRSIDGLYSEAQCWSTVVKPTNIQEASIALNPNAQFTHTTVKPDENPLPFERRLVVMDGEAINREMREMRARHQLQMKLFQAWSYEVEFRGHAQGGKRFVSDTMCTVNDTHHKVDGTYYVQRVQRSYTLGSSYQSKLLLRKPVLHPELTAQVSASARKAQRREVRK